MTITSITTKGQVVIPAAIRKRLKIVKGTRFCILESGGKVILQPITKDYFESVAGILDSKGKALKELLQERQAEKKKEDKS